MIMLEYSLACIECTQIRYRSYRIEDTKHKFDFNWDKILYHNLNTLHLLVLNISYSLLNMEGISHQS